MFKVSLMAQRTPGVPEHGFHTFVDAVFKTLPEGVTVGDQPDIIKFLGAIAPLVYNPGNYDEGDCIAACTLSNPAVYRHIPNAVKLFFRVEEVLSV